MPAAKPETGIGSEKANQASIKRLFRLLNPNFDTNGVVPEIPFSTHRMMGPVGQIYSRMVNSATPPSMQGETSDLLSAR